MRAMLLAYLVDWKSALEQGRQISNVRWRKAGWGPFSPDVLSAIVHLRDSRSYDHISDDLTLEESTIISDLRRRWTNSDIDELQRIVMSTYPMVIDHADEPLNLPALAAVYKQDFKDERARVPA
jgi:hypothetical protein